MEWNHSRVYRFRAGVPGRRSGEEAGSGTGRRAALTAFTNRYNRSSETKSLARWPGLSDADVRRPHRKPFIASDARERMDDPNKPPLSAVALEQIAERQSAVHKSWYVLLAKMRFPLRTQFSSLFASNE